MKKFFKDPEVYFLLGLLGLIIAIPSENIYVNSILIPIFFFFQLVGIIFIIKKYLNEKRAVKLGGKNQKMLTVKENNDQPKNSEFSSNNGDSL